ncbi:hypothetical protein HNO51_04905 [Billgrantia sulfidoxydans]|uniref:Uncharacterized protein n=1 Tax=Billgrantia sulfidoxydans TaxID=2733484 RepID=A0ABX7W168_9GAMM|nr:hypothetical protein [Halomonas sulfidoxydans]QTP54076.1 hypothetical protein HNO51_04905 [Halomonas sulfidoxydans]
MHRTPLSPPPTAPISFAAACLRAVCYILLVAAFLQGIYYEALYLPARRSFAELGFTELCQSAVLSASALLLWTPSVRRELPTVSLLMLALIVASLIREQDYYLDRHLFDGAWQTLVTLVLLPCLTLALWRRRRFLDEFVAYGNSFSFGLFAAGFLVTYVFSRLYGRSAMWMAILEEHYLRTFKEAAEEITELLGYSLLLIAVIELVLLTRRWQQARALP